MRNFVTAKETFAVLASFAARHGVILVDVPSELKKA